MSEAYQNDSPPAFGHPLLQHFMLEPGYLNLNNASYGALPRPVFEVVQNLYLHIEKNPDYFHRVEYRPRLAEARKQLAKLIGAQTDECVLVANASMALTNVFRNIEWEKGDTIICTTTSYISVSRMVHSLGAVAPHPTVSVFELDFPTTRIEILENFRKHLRSLPSAPNKKRVAVFDSIGSTPGCARPWKEMVRICKEEGVLSIVDAAHSIGQEVDINLNEVDPDFWTSNCYKWLMAKRTCAVLYVPKRNQHIIKTSIPSSATHVELRDKEGPGFIDQFEWQGTFDFCPYATIPDALRFREWLGGEKKINEYCHDLALKGGRRLAEVLGTRLLDPTGELTMNIVDVELPFKVEYTLQIEHMFKQKLLVDRKMYATHYWYRGSWWTRCSAQVWNELEDFEKLGRALLEIISEIEKELWFHQGRRGKKA